MPRDNDQLRRMLPPRRGCDCLPDRRVARPGTASPRTRGSLSSQHAEQADHWGSIRGQRCILHTHIKIIRPPPVCWPSTVTAIGNRAAFAPHRIHSNCTATIGRLRVKRVRPERVRGARDRHHPGCAAPGSAKNSENREGLGHAMLKQSGWISLISSTLVAAAVIAPVATEAAVLKPAVANGRRPARLISSALLHGVVNPKGIPPATLPVWALDPLRRADATVSVGAGTNRGEGRDSRRRLQRGSAYHYRIVACTAEPGVFGRDRSFRRARHACQIRTRESPSGLSSERPFILTGTLSGLGGANTRSSAGKSVPIPPGLPQRDRVPGARYAFGRFAFRVANLSETPSFRGSARPTPRPI